MKTILVGFLLVVFACVVEADMLYTITLSDEQTATLRDQMVKVNKLRAQMRVASKSKLIPAGDLTDAQLLAEAVRSLISGWETEHVQAASRRPWSERTVREKRLSCREQKIDPCPK